MGASFVLFDCIQIVIPVFLCVLKNGNGSRSISGFFATLSKECLLLKLRLWWWQRVIASEASNLKFLS